MPGKLTVCEKWRKQRILPRFFSNIMSLSPSPVRAAAINYFFKDREIGGQGEGQRVRPQHVLDQRPRGAKGVLLRRPLRDSKAEGGEHRDRRCRVKTPFCFFSSNSQADRREREVYTE